MGHRLVGFDTPERGDKARCDDERRRAEAAILRLRALVVMPGSFALPAPAGQDRRDRDIAITADCAARSWLAGGTSARR
jgi:hypothetical protein